METKTLYNKNERICQRCKETLPIEKFLRTSRTTRRHVCNHCFYLYTILPCRHRAIIRYINSRKQATLAA